MPSRPGGGPPAVAARDEVVGSDDVVSQRALEGEDLVPGAREVIARRSRSSRRANRRPASGRRGHHPKRMIGVTPTG
jgi:hypothetical protein